MDWSALLLLLGPPVVGGIIGYFTNDIAIRMLFRPYRAVYVLGRRLPFTPGLIPSNQDRLARRIADTIMGSLLTPAELQNLARRLLQIERTQGAIKWLLELSLDQVRTRTQAKTAKIVGNILKDLFGESLPRLLRVWARRDDFLEDQLNQIFDRLLLEYQLSDAQAEQLTRWIFEAVFPPDKIRRTAIDFLTDQNIQAIDTIFRERTSGTYWVVANLFGVRNALTRLRTFCLDEQAVSNARIEELINTLNLRYRIREWLLNLSLQTLPVATVRQMRQSLKEIFRNYLQSSGPELLRELSITVNWESLAAQLLGRLQTSEIVTNSLDPVSKELALVLERYLERDLESLVTQIIPILNIDQVIFDRVVATPARELEMNIQAIVRSELQAIVNLGGILGFFIGGLQGIFLYLR